ncbi:hypothetical protein Tco_1383160 [Tanacetum coccineum]
MIGKWQCYEIEEAAWDYVEATLETRATILLPVESVDKISDVEANLEQFKSETLASQEETRNLFNQMRESIDGNKVEAYRQFAEIMNALKSLQPTTTLPEDTLTMIDTEKSGEDSGNLEEFMVAYVLLNMRVVEQSHNMFGWHAMRLKRRRAVYLGHPETIFWFKQGSKRRVWDPGITGGDMLKQHLEDKGIRIVFLLCGMNI